MNSPPGEVSTAIHIFTHLQRVQAWLSDTQEEVTE